MPPATPSTASRCPRWPTPPTAPPASRRAPRARSSSPPPLKDEGLNIGDVITVERLDTPLTIVGFADGQRTFGHVDIAYVPLDVWQEIHAGARDGEAAPDDAYDQASVVVAKGVDGVVPDLEALSAATGTDARTLEESFESSPGYGPEMMTLSMIEWFLYIIAALVTGAFFLVWTIQRSGDIAVMRAMGATKGFLLRDSLGQAVVILALSIGVGVAIALALGAGLEASPMPYATELAPVAGGAASTSASCSSPATCPPR